MTSCRWQASIPCIDTGRESLSSLELEVTCVDVVAGVEDEVWVVLHQVSDGGGRVRGVTEVAEHADDHCLAGADSGQGLEGALSAPEEVRASL